MAEEEERGVGEGEGGAEEEVEESWGEREGEEGGDMFVGVRDEVLLAALLACWSWL